MSRLQVEPLAAELRAAQGLLARRGFAAERGVPIGEPEPPPHLIRIQHQASELSLALGGAHPWAVLDSAPPQQRQAFARHIYGAVRHLGARPGDLRLTLDGGEFYLVLRWDPDDDVPVTSVAIQILARALAACRAKEPMPARIAPRSLEDVFRGGRRSP